MSTHRASLLTGLRTGGPRSVSNGAYNSIPQTAAIGGQFLNAPAQYPSTLGYDRDHTPFSNDSISIPMTAPANDATFPQFQQQQQTQLMLLQAQAQAQAVQNAVLANQGSLPYGLQSGMTPEQQAMQLQFEVYKMQAMHQQQLQAQILQEAQRQILYQQQAFPNRRRPSEPVTASPYITSFGTSTNHRVVSVANEGSMTAGLDSRFPSGKAGLNPTAASFQFDGSEMNPAPATSNAVLSNNWRSSERAQPSVPLNTPATAGFNANGVLSGGASLGSTSSGTAVSPAKHTLATSWRRSSTAQATERDASRTPSPSASPPTVYVSTPEETSPVQSRSASPPVQRSRPQPLRFSIPATILDQNEANESDGQVLTVIRGPSESPSSPVTPTSGSSTHSAREEATRRLYEGLGIGRPVPQPIIAEPIRHVSQPSRQPHGPPSGVEDLGPRNFATRIRRKAIGGLGVLMDARGRRSSMIEVEAY